MSADVDFTMTTPSLLEAAKLYSYRACPTFHVDQGGSRHFCTECNRTLEAHIIAALRTALQATQTPRDAFVDELERLNYREDTP